MRSQVSSTCAKVSAECSAKRSRCSSVCTCSQSFNRKSSVSRIVHLGGHHRHRGRGLHHQRALAVDSAHTSASVKLRLRPGLRTRPRTPAAPPSRHAAGWSSARPSGSPCPRRPGCARRAHGVVGQRGHHARMHHAAVLQEARQDRPARSSRHPAPPPVGSNPRSTTNGDRRKKAAGPRGRRSCQLERCAPAPPAAIGAPHSCTKWPPSGTSIGGGQLRISLPSGRIAASPSTGSARPMAMKLSPAQRSRQKLPASRLTAAPGRVVTVGHQVREGAHAGLVPRVGKRRVVGGGLGVAHPGQPRCIILPTARSGWVLL
jgi:hypothetical protein